MLKFSEVSQLWFVQRVDENLLFTERAHSHTRGSHWETILIFLIKENVVLSVASSRSAYDRKNVLKQLIYVCSFSVKGHYYLQGSKSLKKTVNSILDLKIIISMPCKHNAILLNTKILMTSHYDSYSPFCFSFFLFSISWRWLLALFPQNLTSRFHYDDYQLNYRRAESFAELFYHGCSVSLIKYQIYTTESFSVLMAFLLSSLSKLLLTNSLSTNECLSIRWNAFWILFFLLLSAMVIIKLLSIMHEW